MKIAITGASGLVGTHLVEKFEEDHDLFRLVRREPEQESEIFWRPSEEEIDEEALDGMDVVVHLAGESIVGRWSEEKKEAIYDSRVTGTRLLSEALANVENPPETLICASAIGYYGNRGDQEVDEDAQAGDLFLSEVVQDWEAAADPARDVGIRVAHMRFGVILSTEGGALAQMITPFKLGLGGRIGKGDQWMSWVDIQDVVGAIDFVMQKEELRGPVNVVSPRPVRNEVFTKTLGSVLWRPTLFPMPAFAARLIFGEMADELLLASTRVVPSKLQEQEFSFSYPRIRESLDHLLA